MNQSFINSTAIVVLHRIMKGDAIRAICSQTPAELLSIFVCVCVIFKLTLFNILISVKLKFMKYERLLQVTSITILYLFIFYHHYYYYYFFFFFFFFFFDGVGFIFFFASSFNFAKRGHIPMIKIVWPGSLCSSLEHRVLMWAILTGRWSGIHLTLSVVRLSVNIRHLLLNHWANFYHTSQEWFLGGNDWKYFKDMESKQNFSCRGNHLSKS